MEHRHYDWCAGDFNGWKRLSSNTIIIDETDQNNPFLVCVYTPTETLLTNLEQKARTLAQMPEFYLEQHRKSWTGENKMKGKMYAHGYRGGYVKGESWGKYFLKPEIRSKTTMHETFLAELDQIVEDYWMAMLQRTTREVADVIRTSKQKGTPQLADSPMGNLTVTINGSTPAHCDKDAYLEENGEKKVGTFAFGAWYDHGTGKIDGGQFFFPQYHFYCPISHGTSLIWSGRDTFHGTARLQCRGDIIRIGTSFVIENIESRIFGIEVH